MGGDVWEATKGFDPKPKHTSVYDMQVEGATVYIGLDYDKCRQLFY